jgi:predicted Zn-dependent protease with MMP-like domain
MADEQMHEGQDSVEEQFVAAAQQPRGSPLLAALCFLLAVLLLLYFFSPQLDSLVKLLVLGVALLAGMLGVILREKRLFASSNAAASEEHHDQTLALSDFEQLVQEALNAIPPEFHEQMENLVVLVEDEPNTDSEEKLYENDTSGHGLLLGLYEGVPLTHQGYHTRLPERITIYQHNIERYCQGDPDRIREQVYNTVLHEVAHHFGMDHHDMPIWVR